jgi:hypothetical protein
VIRKILSLTLLQKIKNKKQLQLKNLWKPKVRVQENLKKAKKLRAQKSNRKKKLRPQMLIQRRLRVLLKLKFLKKKEEKALKSSSRAYLILTKSLSSPISFKKCILKKQCLLTSFFRFRIKRRFLKVILELKSLNVQKFQLKNGNL